MSNNISINGVSYIGNNISIKNGHVVIDGKEVTPADMIEINIIVHGDVETLSVDTADAVTVIGQCQSVTTISGDIDVAGDVNGDVSSISGDIECGSVGGSVSTISGDIKKVQAAEASTYTGRSVGPVNKF